MSSVPDVGQTVGGRQLAKLIFKTLALRYVASYMDEPVCLTTVGRHRCHGNEKYPAQLRFDHFRRMLRAVGQALQERAPGERPVGTVTEFVAVPTDRGPGM